jgi:hypothetical protein
MINDQCVQLKADKRGSYNVILSS